MPKQQAAGIGGAVTLPSFMGFDVASFEVDETQQTESVAAYGGGAYDPHRGSGVPHQSVSVGGFTTYGASGQDPGFGTATTNSAGGAATLQWATGCTMAGNYVASRIRTAHRRVGASVPITAQLENANDPLKTWAIS